MRVMCNIENIETTFLNMLQSLLSFVLHVIDMQNKSTAEYIETLHQLEHKLYKNIFLCKQNLFQIEPKLAWDIENSFKLLADHTAQITESISHRYYCNKYIVHSSL
jgi:hypothetical protein